MLLFCVSNVSGDSASIVLECRTTGSGRSVPGESALGEVVVEAIVTLV